MACIGKHQCEFVESTQHRINCVSIAGGFCEYGEGCHAECEHSWPEDDDEKTEQSVIAFQKYWSDKQYLNEERDKTEWKLKETPEAI